MLRKVKNQGASLQSTINDIKKENEKLNKSGSRSPARAKSLLKTQVSLGLKPLGQESIDTNNSNIKQDRPVSHQFKYRLKNAP